MNVTVLALLGLMCLDVFYTYVVGQQWAAYAQLIGLGLAFTCAFVIQDRRQFLGCVATLALYSVGVSYFYISSGQQVATGDVLGTDIGVNQVVGDRNYKSFECGIGVIIGLYFLVSSGLANVSTRFGPVLSKVLGAFLASFCGYAFLQTQSRGGIIALFGASVGLGLHRVRTAWSSVLLVTIIVVMVGLTQFASLIAGFGDRFRNADAATLSTRVDIWNDTLAAFVDGNLMVKIVGRGVGGAEIETGGSTHNGGLRILLDQGVIGVALWVTLMTIAFARSWKRRDDVGALQFGLLVFAGLASLSIEPHYFIPAFGILLGVSVAALPGAVRARHGKPQATVRAASA